MYLVWLIVVGVVVSLLSNFVVLKSRRSWGGYLALMIADLVGAWLGNVVFGNWALINDYNEGSRKLTGNLIDSPKKYFLKNATFMP